MQHQLVGEQLETRSTSTTVEIFQRGRRVASHVRSFVAYHHSTQHQHRPKSHQAHLERTPSRLIEWGQSVGEATGQLIRNILESKPRPEIGYRACLGIMSLGKLFSPTRLETACRRALEVQAYSYQSVKSILRRGLDRQRPLKPEAERSTPEHENLRGSNYYDPASKLVQ